MLVSGPEAWQRNKQISCGNDKKLGFESRVKS